MIYLIHVDGNFPNLALMKLSAWLKSQGETVALIRGTGRRTLFDSPTRIYASSIFEFSKPLREAVTKQWGEEVIWGGTGVSVQSNLKEVADVDWDAISPDYSLYPDFMYSLGFTQRGCRLTCKFCVVPKKEGKPYSVGSINDIWRKPPYPRKIMLLDNDFFGQPETAWRSRLDEMKDGGFRVSFSQGINIRQVTEVIAEALKGIEYRDNEFKERILYTAWDNLGDEDVFKRGVAILERAGIPGKHLRVYMLVGYAKQETFEQVHYRFNQLVQLGCQPYPMVYDQARKDLKAFQRWAVTGLYRCVSWAEYRDPRKQEVHSGA